MGGILGRDDLLGTALRYGPSQPDSLVVLFHGVASNCSSLQDFAEKCADVHPSTQFVLLQAPHPVGSDGFEWFSYERPQEPEESEQEFINNVILPAIRKCQWDVNNALEELMRDLELTCNRVILAGFGQGAAVAAYAGLPRGVGGVLLMAGPPSPIHQNLLPDIPNAKVMLIAGGNDPWCPPTMLSKAFQKYTLYDDRVVVLPGVSHRMSEAHVTHASAFFSFIFDDTS